MADMSARNAGIAHRKGKYVMMDCDDVCLPDRLRKQVNFLEAHPEIDVGLVSPSGLQTKT